MKMSLLGEIVALIDRYTQTMYICAMSYICAMLLRHKICEMLLKVCVNSRQIKFFFDQTVSTLTQNSLEFLSSF